MSDVAVKREFDVVVLGGGAAGSVAAATAASHGRTVLLVSQFAGATAQSSGAVDGGEQVSLLKLRELTADLFCHARQEQILVASEAGTLKATSLVQQTQAFDWAKTSEDSKIGVIGFSGLPSFDAESVAKMLAWSAKQILGRDLQVVPIHIDLPGSWRSPLEMAKWADTEEGSQALINALQKNLKGCSAYLLPAMLGITQYKKIWESLQSTAPTFELLGMPTAVPGLRLQAALESGIVASGVQRVKGQAIGATLTDGRIESLQLEGPLGSQSIACKAVILATGRYFSGGFERSGIRREKLFKLPLWWRGKLIGDLASRGLTSASMSDEHGLLEASIRTDENLRPYTQTMDIYASNLFAAGSGLTRMHSLGSAVQSAYESAFHTLKEFER